MSLFSHATKDHCYWQGYTSLAWYLNERMKRRSNVGFRSISDIQGRPCSSPTIFSWNPYLLSGPIPVGVACMGGPSNTAVVLPGEWWCACELCHVRSVSIRSRLFQIHAEAVSAVSWSFLMVACLMRGATPIAFKNFTVDCPTKPR